MCVVCVCVCVREHHSLSVCVRVSVCVCVCVSACECWTASEPQSVCVCVCLCVCVGERQHLSVCVCVCVCVCWRASEPQCVCVCVCVLESVRASVCVFRLTVSRSSLWILWKIIWLMCLCSDGERQASEVRLLLHTSRLDLSTNTNTRHSHTSTGAERPIRSRDPASDLCCNGGQRWLNWNTCVSERNASFW